MEYSRLKLVVGTNRCGSKGVWSIFKHQLEDREKNRTAIIHERWCFDGVSIKKQMLSAAPAGGYNGLLISSQ